MTNPARDRRSLSTVRTPLLWVHVARRWVGGVCIACVLIAFVAALWWPVAITAIAATARSEFNIVGPGGSIKWFELVSNDPRWSAGLWNSLLVAVLSAASATITGTLAAIGVARSQRAEDVVKPLAAVVLFVPGLLLATGELLAAQRVGIPPGLLLLAAAHAVVAQSLVFLVVLPTAVNLQRYLLLANGLGASSWQSIARVALPLMSREVTAAAVLSLVFSLNESAACLLITSTAAPTLPRLIYQSLRSGVSPVAAAAAITLAAATMVLLGTAAGVWWLGRMRRHA